MNITIPGSMNLLDWADQVTKDLDTVGALGKLENEVYWQDWAAQFLNNSMLGSSLPNPYGFTEWREWAERFCGALL